MISKTLASQLSKMKPAVKKRKEHRPPETGAEFTRRYKGKEYQMRVISMEGGIGYKTGGAVYKSPSAAANSITKTAVNGWGFWEIDG